jgi:aminoglycoside phosphotransferase (APT) family kinase protein
VVRDGGLPDFDSTAILHKKVAELDRIAGTGRVPADLLNRWERAIEDVNLFRYRPTVLHGGITSVAIHLEGQRLIGLSGWQNLRIGDPAEDFVWLIQGTLENTQADTMLTYRTIRTSADENLQQRATLYSELALGQWLLHLLNSDADVESISEAEDMLADLRSDLEGGKLPDLKSSSFIGMAAATSLLPEITRINTGAIEVVTEPQKDSDELF